METKANYVLIGAFTIVVTLFLLLFALWAAKYSSEKDWTQVRGVFNEPVTGLCEGSPVHYNGISVGTVESLRLAPDDPRRVLATLAPAGRHAGQGRHPRQDLHAQPHRRRRSSSSPAAARGSPSLADVDRSEVPVIQTEASALQNIADTANRLVARMDQVLSEENVKRVSDSLANIEAMTGAIADQREDLRAHDHQCAQVQRAVGEDAQPPPTARSTNCRSRTGAEAARA